MPSTIMKEDHGAEPGEEAAIGLDAVVVDDVVLVHFPILEPGFNSLPVVGAEVMPVLDD